MSYKELRTPRVYVPNKSFHDFEAATRFGEFVYLTQGRLPPKFNMNDVARRCQEVLQDAKEFDYLLISGPHSVCSVATAILAYRFGRINYLVWDPAIGDYVSRPILLTRMLEREEVVDDGRTV